MVTPKERDWLGVNDGFRGVQWGSSMAATRSQEVSPIFEAREESLIYMVDLFDVDSLATFAFENDKLVRGRYWFGPERVGNAEAIYRNLEIMLARKYGQHADSS